MVIGGMVELLQIFSTARTSRLIEYTWSLGALLKNCITLKHRQIMRKKNEKMKINFKRPYYLYN